MKAPYTTVWFSLVLVLCLGPPAHAATNDLWFPVGETLEYRLYWGIIPVGKTRIWSEWIEEDGNRYVALRMTAKTGKIVSTVYPVNDFVESIVAPDTFLPVRYTQRLKEGRKKRRNEIWYFDHAHETVEHHDFRKSETNTYEIAEDTRDILTFIYHMRHNGVDIGKSEVFKVIADDKVYDLVLGDVRRETIRLGRFGRVRTLHLEPLAKFGGIFNRKGRIWVWFSDDDRRVCVQMMGKVPIANFRAVLTKVRGPGNDRWVTSGRKRR
jgi:hypothetical protein